MKPPTAGRILLTGATGYVGGRLLKRLESQDRPLRCLVRYTEGLKAIARTQTEIFQGDMLLPETLGPAMAGIDQAYYLLHSMAVSGDFVSEERRAAENFSRACRLAGVRRIIYLGGLGDPALELSEHLRSRQEVGDILRGSGVPVVEFRASIIIGSGSLSFEMIRSLVERLPVMITPKWVATRAQPIAIDDVLAYLLAALDMPLPESRTYEIGGSDILSYGEIMREYGRQRGLRRIMIPVPVLTPKLSGLWLGLVTPIYARVGRKLVESLRYPTVVRDPSALKAFPFRPNGVAEAIARALRNEDREFVESHWTDALSSGGLRPAWGGARFGSRLVDTHTIEIKAPPEDVFRVVQGIGGETGWYFAGVLWKLRGFIDLLVGGVGMRRGRRDPVTLRPGDALDFWRVESVEPGCRLLLQAEMKLPGRAWLEFTVSPSGDNTLLRQTALFDPVGLAGLAYWYTLYPIHLWIFLGMQRGMARAAESQANT